MTAAELSTDVVINVQLGGVQLYFVLIMLCTGRDWNRVANAPRGWSTTAYRVLFQTAVLEERCKVGCDDDDGGTGSFVGHERCDGQRLSGRFHSKGASESSGWSRDSEVVCCGTTRGREHPNVERCRKGYDM